MFKVKTLEKDIIEYQNYGLGWLRLERPEGLSLEKVVGRRKRLQSGESSVVQVP